MIIIFQVKEHPLKITVSVPHYVCLRIPDSLVMSGIIFGYYNWRKKKTTDV